MAKLPWSNNVDTDIITPCKFCSEEALSVTGGKYCMDCYRELLTNIILNRYPVSGKDVVDKLYKNDVD
jgi:3-isopropylmalate dehydratase small subunit